MGFFNANVKDDHKVWDRIAKEIEKTRFSFVEVGYPNGEEKKKDHDGKEEEGITVVEVATEMEFGNPDKRIPPRPTLIPTFDEQKEKIFTELKGQYNEVLIGKQTTEKALNKIGVFLQKKVIDKINNLFSPPLAKATIAKKGSSKPLIDTGQMRQSVKSKVTITNRPQPTEENKNV
jgi:hypothetical protein